MKLLKIYVMIMKRGKKLVDKNKWKYSVKYNLPFCFLGDSCQAIYDYLHKISSLTNGQYMGR